MIFWWVPENSVTLFIQPFLGVRMGLATARLFMGPGGSSNAFTSSGRRESARGPSHLFADAPPSGFYVWSWLSSACFLSREDSLPTLDAVLLQSRVISVPRPPPPFLRSVCQTLELFSDDVYFFFLLSQIGVLFPTESFSTSRVTVFLPEVLQPLNHLHL